MAAPSIEERVALLEAEMNEVKLTFRPSDRPKNPWATFGIMAGHKDYDEVVRLGREYRDSLCDSEEE